MTEVLMPRLSDSMEEGTVIRWLVGDGEELSVGAELAEIETDKATMVFEAELEGRLRTLVAEGETVPVGTPIATVGAVAREPEASPRRVKASPLARRLAAELGVDLAAVTGSGPGGRIVRKDVEAEAGEPSGEQRTPMPASRAAAEPRTQPAAAGSETAKGTTETVELTRKQQLVARRMAESKATAPDFALTREVSMDAAVRFREELRAWNPESRPPSYNDLVVKACAVALRLHPRVNGAYRDGRWELYSRINVGIAVAAGDGSLLVPTIPDADLSGLARIAETSRRLAAAAREGSIEPPELSGGTFTVSNLGMFGIESFTAIINPPQSSILAVGALREVPVAEAGEVAIGWRMSMTLCCDHRILSGAEGAEFLARVSSLLEAPGALAL